MNGSIENRSKNTWRLMIELGRDSQGKRLRKSLTVKGTKADAQKQLREVLASLDKGLPISNSNETLGEFLNQWLHDYAESNTCPRTVEGYRGNIRRYLKPALGHIPLAKLTPQHVQALYSDMLSRGLSARTVLHTHRVLSESMSHAIKWGLLVRNVCDAVSPPRPRNKEMHALDITDAQRLLEASARSPYGSIFFLALYTGMRRGEVLGLRWSDIYLENKSLSVNQTVIRLNGSGVTIGAPKTKYSRRLISLPPTAVGLLKGLKARRMEQMEAVGLEWDERNFVFLNSDGGPLSPDTVSHAFSKIVAKLDIKRIRFHDLRHTHATLMLKEGVHPKIVSERLGHSSINLTLDTYSHVLPGLQEAAANVFEEALRNNVSVPEQSLA